MCKKKSEKTRILWFSLGGTLEKSGLRIVDPHHFQNGDISPFGQDEFLPVGGEQRVGGSKTSPIYELA